MAIKYIKYTREQRKSSRVTGYTLYVNSTFRYICDSIQEISKEARSYSKWSDIEIYQILARS